MQIGEIVRMDFEAEYDKVGPGSLLIADPYGGDPYFRRSLVLIVSHEPEGTFGFVLNKQLSLPLGDLIEEFPSGSYMPCLGGPVHTSTLNYIHRLGEMAIPKSLPIADGLYWGGDFDWIRQMITTGELQPRAIKFFLGSAGWESGQLRREFQRGDWGLCPPNRVDIIASSVELWYQAVERSEHYSHWGLIPEDPADN